MKGAILIEIDEAKGMIEFDVRADCDMVYGAAKLMIRLLQDEMPTADMAVMEASG